MSYPHRSAAALVGRTSAECAVLRRATGRAARLGAVAVAVAVVAGGVGPDGLGQLAVVLGDPYLDAVKALTVNAVDVGLRDDGVGVDGLDDAEDAHRLYLAAHHQQHFHRPYSE